MSIIKGEQAKVVTIFGTVTIPSGSRSRTGYLARPDLAGEWPTIVVIETPGAITSPVKEVCRRLARQGFAVLAPNMDRPRDLDVFVDFITNRAGFWSNAEHGFGVLGLGPGGTLAVQAAVSRRLVSALALVGAAVEPEDAQHVRVPMLGANGRAGEAMASLEKVRAVVPQAKWALYKGLDDDWWNDAADGFDVDAASDTVERVAGFFAVHLPPTGE